MSNDLIQKNAELGRFLFCERYTLQPVKNALYIAEGQDLKRGAVVDVNGYLIGTEGLQPYAVLENDCDTREKGAFASVFIKGEFNFDKLFFADGLSKENLDLIVYNGSKVGIVIKPYTYSSDFSPKSDDIDELIPEDASKENKLVSESRLQDALAGCSSIDEKLKVIAAALDGLNARIDALESVAVNNNIGSVIADYIDTQTLLVGGSDLEARVTAIEAVLTNNNLRAAAAQTPSFTKSVPVDNIDLQVEVDKTEETKKEIENKIMEEK